MKTTTIAPANRNKLMRTIKILNAVERCFRGVSWILPGAAKLADDIALANRNVAEVRNAGKASTND